MKIEFRAIEGYAYGAIQPSVTLRFPEGDTDLAALAKSLVRLIALLPPELDPDPFGTETEVMDRPPALFLRALAALNLICGDRRFTAIATFKEEGGTVFAVPTLSIDLTWHNLAALSGFLRDTGGQITAENAEPFFKKIKAAHRKFLPGGTNAVNFLEAAAARKVPFRTFQQDYLIFGYGSGTSLFKSSITDRETSVGVSLAHSKVDTNRLLRLSGLPVPDQARIQTLDQAAHLAGELGYPVVLKPESESRGRGVYADIRDRKELEYCFNRLTKDYRILLLEKHVPGDHYRIDFMGDTLIKAVRRRPPVVVGDGTMTVRQLVEVLNRDPERLDPYSSKQIVALDEDLYRRLQKQNLVLDDVPQAGRRIPLKSISNLGQGGEQVHMEDQIHPENYALCRTIARIMRLDVLGVDLLSPDLSQPWYSNGTVICEVNAQPQLGTSGTQVYWDFLARYLRPPARVELTVAQQAGEWGAALFDPSVSELHLKLSAEEVLAQGCPVQYFDALEIAEDVTPADRRKLERMLISVVPLRTS